jgi:homoserine O-acetyltransferase/O-succinyltransferase
MRIACLALFASSVLAADFPAPIEGDFVIPNFRFQSGELLAQLRIHYVTIGSPANPAVLVLHGTGGSVQQFLSGKYGPNFSGALFGKGQPLDATRYFIVIADGIGHGKSSKPSDELHAGFPHYRYNDMVAAQHLLMTEHLKIQHVRLVMGTSMGGMQTWMWGEMYPDYMDALMPLASAPVQIAGFNRMRRKMMIDSIRNDPEWKDGEYSKQPRGLTFAAYLLLTMGAAPLYLQSQAPTRAAADALLAKELDERLPKMDANDLLYTVEASEDYDPSAALESIKAPLLAVNSADDQINPPELRILEREIKRVKQGRFVLLPVSAETRGHSTHTLAGLWQKYLVELLSTGSR